MKTGYKKSSGLVIKIVVVNTAGIANNDTVINDAITLITFILIQLRPRCTTTLTLTIVPVTLWWINWNYFP